MVSGAPLLCKSLTTHTGKLHQPMYHQRNRDALILAALCFLCFFFNLGAVSLFDFNEGLYVQAAREMYIRGDWITPTVNGHFFFDKPPLALWLDVASFHLFGVNEFAARLPVAIAATALVFLTWFFGAKYLSRRAGLLGAAMLALSPLFIGTARQMTMDIHQTLWFAIAMFCFFRGYAAEAGKDKWWYLGFWAGCGVAVLAKSIPGLFPIPAALAFVIIDERFKLYPIYRRIRESKPLLGVLLLFAVIAPWHYLAYRANGTVFYEEYWLLHHVKLANGQDFSHKQPIYYYIPAILAGMLPWGFLLPWTIRRNSAEAAANEESATEPQDRAHRFLVVWFVSILVIFSLMTSKLASYMLVLYPAAALLIGDWMSRTWETRASKRFAAAVTAIPTLFGLLAFGASIYIRSEARRHGSVPEYPADTWTWAVGCLAMAAIIAAGASIFAWAGLRGRAIVCLFASVTCAVAIAFTIGLPMFEAKVNSPLHRLARELGERSKRGAAIAIHIGQPRKPSVFFYLPDDLFKVQPRRAEADDIIVERGEREPIDTFIRSQRMAYILTDAKRAKALLDDTPSLKVDQTQGRWELLKTTPLQASSPGRRREN